jgi:uncharacterized protein YndB with AHSA1/START domain
MQYTEKFIEIDAPVERVFDLFSNFENFPRWMRNIKDVHYSGRHFTRWTASAPLGSEVEWEAETVIFEPDHKIAWRSVRGDVDTEGEVIFEETARGTTRMRVVLGYDPPAGRLGAMIASLFGKNPEQQLEDDLERFASVAEGRRHVRPYRDETDDSRKDERDDKALRRSRVGRREIRGYDSYTYDGREVHRVKDDERGERDSRRDDEQRREAYRRSVEYREEEPPRRIRDRNRFDDELRAARRSQMESQRRYHEELERDERRRYLAERDEQIRRSSGYRERGERHEGYAPARYDDDERTRRHALTPRERARERERREPDYGYAEKAFNRGVDKLLDDAPSKRWRR